MQPFEQLEQEWARFNDLNPKGMVACSSGTAALHLALEAMQLPPGSEVLVPDFTMIACPRAVTLAGLTPVFVDCDERLCVDVSLMAEAQDGDCVEAMMFVHIYGRRCNMSGIVRSRMKKELRIVEDLAEAHGVRPHACTDAACWSFYKNKIVAGEEGGAVWFRDPEHAALARQLRSLGFTDAHDFWHVPRGHNYRMSNAHAELVLSNFWDEELGDISKPAMEYITRTRREIEGWYDKYCPDEWRMPKRDAVWVYDLRLKGLAYGKLDEVVKACRDAGIEARHGFKPCHEQREYAGCRAVGPERQWKVCAAAREVMYLPVLPGRTTEEDCRHAFEVIRKVTS